MSAQDQTALDLKFLKAVQEHDFDTALTYMAEGAKPNNVAEECYYEFATPKNQPDTRATGLKFLIDQCQIDLKSEHSLTAFTALVAIKDLDNAAIMLERGLDLNSRYTLEDGTTETLFTHYMTQHDPPIEHIQFFIDHGADVTADNQKALTHCILKCRHAHVKLLLGRDADLNRDDGAFFENLLHEIHDACLQDEMSNNQFMRVFNFLLNMDVDLSLGDARALRSFYDKQKDNTPYTAMIRARLMQEIESTINASPYNLSAIFNNNAADELTRKMDNGFRVVDYICAQKKLSDVFDTARWNARELSAIKILDTVLPHYAHEAAEVKSPLQYQKAKQGAPEQARATLKRRLKP